MTDSSDVWYRSHPKAALLIAVVLFIGVTAAGVFVDSSGEAVAVLYVLPIALLAVTRGLRGGLFGATLGVLIFGSFAIWHNNGDLDATGWVTRVTAMFLLGGLLGHATDRISESDRRALAEERRRCELEGAARREREALEINDSILQGIAAAKWFAEAGRADDAAKVLTETMDKGEELVSALLAKSGEGMQCRPPAPDGQRSASEIGTAAIEVL